MPVRRSALRPTNGLGIKEHITDLLSTDQVDVLRCQYDVATCRLCRVHTAYRTRESKQSRVETVKMDLSLCMHTAVCGRLDGADSRTLSLETAVCVVPILKSGHGLCLVTGES